MKGIQIQNWWTNMPAIALEGCWGHLTGLQTHSVDNIPKRNVVSTLLKGHRKKKKNWSLLNVNYIDQKNGGWNGVYIPTCVTEGETHEKGSLTIGP